MELAEALDIVVGRTGVQRYRELCDPARRDYHPEFVPWIIEHAKAPPGPPGLPSILPHVASLAGSLAEWYADAIQMFRAMYWGAEPPKVANCCGGKAIEPIPAPSS